MKVRILGFYFYEFSQSGQSIERERGSTLSSRSRAFSMNSSLFHLRLQVLSTPVVFWRCIREKYEGRETEMNRTTETLMTSLHYNLLDFFFFFFFLFFFLFFCLFLVSLFSLHLHFVYVTHTLSLSLFLSHVFVS